jgi:hypothetical protein
MQHDATPSVCKHRFRVPYERVHLRSDASGRFETSQLKPRIDGDSSAPRLALTATCNASRGRSGRDRLETWLRMLMKMNDA